MNMITKEQSLVKHFNARTIYAVIEENGVFQSPGLTMGFARFGKEQGVMTPHIHVEEGMYVIDCANAYARWGDTEQTLGERHPVRPGMIMWAAEGEWHVFEFDDGGFLDIVFALPVSKLERPK